MANAPQINPSTRKSISEYFDGDEGTGSVYKYRTGYNLEEMFSSRFNIPGLTLGSASRWTLCDATIEYMYQTGRINEFFTTMLSLRNVSKELGETNQARAAEKRKSAIDDINRILLADDLELLDFNNRLILHKIDDVTDMIGSGGFANVYRVPGNDKVVKKLRDEFKDNDGIISRFKNEFRLIHDKLQGITGIIEAYEYDEDEISYTMEYCSSDLKKYIEDSYLDDDRKAELILGILEIMNQVHERQVWHRDLSPKNIFIKDGHPVIADFGLGKAIDESGRTYVTIDTSMNGTLEYCDPRQFQGLGFADEQSDIYSLGRIINYVMTGDSDNFKHTFNLVSTLATESSLDARYHSVQEMIDKITRLTSSREDTAYTERCEQLVSTGYYDPSMDDYLLSFDEDYLIGKLNNANFRKVYGHVISNVSYTSAMVERFTSLHNIFLHPVGHTFASFDDVSMFCVDMLRKHKEMSASLKAMLGECIYDITEGVNRWNAQRYFDDHYRDIEREYIQEALSASMQRRK